MEKDTILVVLSDLHTGSNKALFPNRFWKGKNGNNHTPTSQQVSLFEKFQEISLKVRQARKGKRVVLVHDGDAIEGVHHNNIDVCTRDVTEQAAVHVELISHFQNKIDWQRGDKLYYVTGTETHTADKEDDMARELNAEQGDDDLYMHNHLELVVNGRPIWFVHHGPPAGKGANEGNAVRNWLRDIYWDAKKDNNQPPAMVFTGHVHTPTYSAYIANDKGVYFLMHGIICPSFQAKTRYAHMAAPVARNKIGAVWCELKADGEIKTPIFSLMETKSIDRVEI